MPPRVATVLHLRVSLLTHGTGAPLHHHTVLNAGCLAHGRVGIALEWHHLTATEAAVSGDQHTTLRVVDAIAQRFGAESAEHHAVNGTDARAGQHRDRGFGNHRQIDRDAISLLHAEASQDVRELADFNEELPVRQCALIARFPFEDDGGFVAPCRAHMPVETVGRHVELSIAEPGGEGCVPFEPLREWTDPFQFLGHAHPVRIRIGGRVARYRLVAHIGGTLKRRRWRKTAILSQQRVDLGHVAGMSVTSVSVER